MSICEKCYKFSICKIASPNMIGCIEYLPYEAVKKSWLKKMVKIAALVSCESPLNKTKPNEGNKP